MKSKIILIDTVGQISHSESIFVFYCCHNKLPQIQWLKTTKTFFPSTIGQISDIDLTGLKSKVSAGLHSFLEALGENVSLPFLVASRRHLHFLAYGPFVHLQRQQSQISLILLQSLISLSAHSQERFSASKDSCDQTDPPE